MSSELWQPAEEALLKALVEQGLNDTEVIAKFREAGIERSAKAIERKRERLNLHAQVAVSIFTIADPLTIEGDALILADIHAPFHCAEWLNRVVNLAAKWGITNCGIAGDLFDAATFCKWGHRADLTFKAEVEATQQIMASLAGVFELIVFSLGNHEMRLERAVNYLAEFSAFAEGWIASEKVKLTKHHYFFVASAGQRYRVTHPRNTSVHATIVPKRLCSKFHCHVIAGHGHTVGMTRDDSGNYWAIDSGIMADPDRLDYAVLEDNTRPRMQQGCVIIRGGIPVLLTPQNIELYER